MFVDFYRLLKARACAPSILFSIVLPLVVLLYGSVFFVLQRRIFDPDEFFHLHSAWCVFKGLLPYRDYFEHHTPLYYFLLAPMFHFFNAEIEAAEAVAALFFARNIMWLLGGLLLILTYRIGKLWRGTEVGLSTEAYWHKALEIRPDTLAVALLLCYSILTLRALEPNQNPSTSKHRFGWSGVFLGLAFLALQKIVFVFPGLAIGTLWYLFSPSPSESRRVRFGNVLMQLVGFSAPIVLTLAYFSLQGSLREFFYYNFFFNLGLPGFSPVPRLQDLVYQHPYLALFGAAGLILSVSRLLKPADILPADYFILPATISLIAGVFVIPVPYEQYFLFFLPLVALFASYFLTKLVTLLSDMRHRLETWQWISMATATSLLVGIFLVSTAHGQSSQWPTGYVSSYWLAAFFGIISLLFVRLRVTALIFFLAAISVPPALRVRGALIGPDYALQVQQITYVIENTRPEQTVMDGFTGVAVYRPHAMFFRALPSNVRQMIAEADKQEILNSLRAGSIAPQLILLDHNLRELHSEIEKFIEENYEPVGLGDIWRRKS